MAFDKPLPEWNEPGIEPPQSKKNEGWLPREKPPAQWHNWFQHLTYEALKELQEKAAHVTFGNTAPASPAENDLWIDTSVTPHVLRRFNGSGWTEVGKTSIHWDEVEGKPSQFPPAPHTHEEADIVDLDKYTKAQTDTLISNAVNNAVNQSKEYTDQAIDDIEFPVTSVNDKTGDVTITKSDVGLGQVQNYGVATQAEAEEGTSNTKYMTPQRTKQAIDSLSPVKSVNNKTGNVTLTASDVGAETPQGAQAKANQAEENAKNYADQQVSAHASRTDNPHNVTKQQVGLGNVDNVQQIPMSQKGQPNGVATLDDTGKVPSSQLPEIDAPVKSVNGKTGDVQLTASDVGAPTVQQHDQLEQKVDAHEADYASLETVIVMGGF